MADLDGPVDLEAAIGRPVRERVSIPSFASLPPVPRTLAAMLALLVASGCQVANERADDRRADLQPGEIRPPSASEWVDGGVVLRAGNPGAWDVRLEGMLSPCAALERDGMYFLYYIGAAGDRSTDGGPRGRKLGVAFGPDPSRLSKYESNPVLSHAVGIPDCEECGVWRRLPRQ